MVRRILLLTGLVSVSLLSASMSAAVTADSPSPTDPVYWCVFQCVDGTEGGGPASSGTECKALADSQCRNHGGTRMTGLDPYTSPASQ
jgi:hypothetical protein